MKSEGEDKQGNQRSSGRQARAMTRAIDMVSEEFIESFSQTGKDDGPETPAKPSPIREALAARERREAEEAKKAEAKPAFKGFGGLLAGASSNTDASNHTTAATPEPAQAPAAEAAESHTTSHTNVPGVETTPDGSVIRVKDTVGKKRGLYTSAMQKPSAEQIADAAVKFSRPDSRPHAEPLPAQAEPAAEQAPLKPPPQPISKSPFARGGSAAYSASTSSTPHSASPYASPPAYAAPPEASASYPSSFATQHDDGDISHAGSTKARRPVAGKSKMTTESSCPIACGMGEMMLQVRRLFSWAKSVFGK